jgi:hypothetical protein
MRYLTSAAIVLSLALAGSASAQMAPNPVSGAARGAAAGSATGAAAAGPLGAAVGAPLGAAAGAVAGTAGAVGAVAGGVVGAPAGMAMMGGNYCPAGYVPANPPNTLPANVTGVGYCVPAMMAPRQASRRMGRR